MTTVSLLEKQECNTVDMDIIDKITAKACQPGIKKLHHDNTAVHHYILQHSPK